MNQVIIQLILSLLAVLQSPDVSMLQKQVIYQQVIPVIQSIMEEQIIEPVVPLDVAVESKVESSAPEKPKARVIPQSPGMRPTVEA